MMYSNSPSNRCSCPSQNSSSMNRCSANLNHMDQRSMEQNSMRQTSMNQNAMNHQHMDHHSMNQNSAEHHSMNHNPMGQNNMGHHAMNHNSMNQNCRNQRSMNQNSIEQNNMGKMCHDSRSSASGCPSMQDSSRYAHMNHMSQEQLLNHINEVSFVISDLLLYLDTHPDDQQALDFCKDHIDMRTHALTIYARLYGPLTIDTADDNASRSWRWVETPWPWEGRLK